jgi:anti-sigma regulatory factor (Ser/Thr protein kinase)
VSDADGADAGLVHEAMLYRDDAEFLSGVVGQIRTALAADQPVMVELPGARGDLVRDALGADADRVRFGDMTDHGRNPGRIIPGVMHDFIAGHLGRRVTIVAESTWASRSAPEYAACVEHEALTNLAFAGQEVSILCPYNLTDLFEDAVADAERTHPALRQHGARRRSTGYTEPHAVVDSIAARQPPTPAHARRLDYDVVSQARYAATEWGRGAGLTGDRLTDLMIAVSEVGGNSVAHTGHGGSLLCWQDGDSLVYEMRDGGHIQDLLAGRVPPPMEAESGRGLLMVNLLCDLVQVKTGPSGTAIRLWMTVPPQE